MSLSRLILVLAGWWLTAAAANTIRAQVAERLDEPTALTALSAGADADSGDPIHTLLRATYQRKARALRFVAGDTSSTLLAIEPEPVMTWTSLGGWSGDVFAWTGKGRVQIVGCIGSQRLEDGMVRVFQEFHSFADEALEDVRLDERQSWRIPVKSTSVQTIPGAPPPAATEARRLIQMRRLARSFTAGMQVTQDDVEKEMRLLSQPLVRETGGQGKVFDSGLFAFVSSSGTDPEAFLLIEARKIDTERAWTYVAARFTTREIWMSRDGEELWRVAAIENWDWGPQIERPYFYRDESKLTTAELETFAQEH